MSRRRGSPRRAARGGRGGGAWADVVVAVIRDGGRVLVARRSDEQHLGGHDEFPGGRREPGESLEEACVREVKEEVGLAVRVVRTLAVAWHRDAQRRLALTFFECACEGGRDIAPEAARRGARWVEARSLGELRFPPANREVVRRLVLEASAPPPES
jgi:mutator protein MutT